MDAETREYVLGRLRFTLQHTPQERFDLRQGFDNLAEIVEEGGPLTMGALHQMVSMNDLVGDNRKRVVRDIIDPARDGTRCCMHPCCPINLLIDVAATALAEDRGLVGE